MIITFVGHSFIVSGDEIKEKVKEQILKNTNGEAVICYLGWYGDFDEICARACKELKKEIIDIELVYISPYINLSEQKKINQLRNFGLCDTSIYPPLENVPPKFAISKRNEWMVTNADLVISYVKHSYGGAYKTLLVAKRKKKKIINIFDCDGT